MISSSKPNECRLTVTRIKLYLLLLDLNDDIAVNNTLSSKTDCLWTMDSRIATTLNSIASISGHPKPILHLPGMHPETWILLLLQAFLKDRPEFKLKYDHPQHYFRDINSSREQSNLACRVLAKRSWRNPAMTRFKLIWKAMILSYRGSVSLWILDLPELASLFSGLGL